MNSASPLPAVTVWAALSNGIALSSSSPGLIFPSRLLSLESREQGGHGCPSSDMGGNKPRLGHLGREQKDLNPLRAPRAMGITGQGIPAPAAGMGQWDWHCPKGWPGQRGKDWPGQS